MLQGILIYGVINSMILLLTALGFNLTFGISGVANFAYGALYVMTGYMAWIGLNTLGLPYYLSASLAVLITSALAALLYRYILLRVRGLVVSEVIATFAIGLVVLESFRYLGFIGFEYKLPVLVDASVAIGDTYVAAQRLFLLAVGVLLTGFLWFFTHFTKLGLAFRGIAQNEHTALTLGINVDKVAALSVAFGAAYAAIAALVILPLGIISVPTGYDVLVNALAVCIVGGLGSTLGVVIASFLIGFSQFLTATFFATHWMMIVSLLAILVILVVKPSGIMGQQKQLEERI